MCASRRKLDAWNMGEGSDRSPDPGVNDEGFDSFGPVGEFRRSQQHPSRPPAPQSPHDFIRILVAEDDSFHRRVLRVLLASPRVSMIEVEDGQAAVDLLALRSFDLVLLDLSLPRMSGEDVVRWIRQSHTPWADIPILGMVDDDMQSKVGRLALMGMTDWIAKPVDRQQLADRIVRLMPAIYDVGL